MRKTVERRWVTKLRAARFLADMFGPPILMMVASAMVIYSVLTS